MYTEYNPNPAGRRVGDCSVRAISKALDLDWEQAFCLICTFAYNMCDMPSSDSVWGAVLRSKGFYRVALPSECPDCYTAKDFCEEHPNGTYVLGFGGHVATVVDGNLYDAWDSSNEINYKIKKKNHYLIINPRFRNKKPLMVRFMLTVNRSSLKL